MKMDDIKKTEHTEEIKEAQTLTDEAIEEAKALTDEEIEEAAGGMPSRYRHPFEI